ncbi:MAG: tRNA (adenosine(37)-N6)-threonylcarbamoyltransferase complex dimerization subunit type 1 TsaB [Deltaproteobacteria bacterium]|nr:tRNA (adenosine(37)-N6)-threonylcarbamoyltransferase complex dimerization subunit type 1 TsaB [Deltaproteobacteria bacterium]MBW1921209.1 tRNA (adenosine(37)-N6)-threonylcarbamoyltransferase complex dimerization subunit type 1 TsaB [Deltaproteobacteria bacterium]MBW1935444.1 tRNA (adenosine(37)-N6)-threonylcarbamoyltransferase complex dimerization subunit type 1 TsaB [Deltaproteobacteria bacterium]MBW1977482.1 tRNA (adenosine(37)-N6)-threonylcarbamoyltransferase complex dimerization subunit t
MILAINTSTTQFSIAILEDDGAILAEEIIFSGSKSFYSFMPALKELFSYSRVETAQLNAVAVSIGPGSFTGLRVGLSAAKGMCRALGIPIVGVSSLEAMAVQVPFSGYPVCPLISSRKGELFAALFKWSATQNRMMRITEDKCFRLKELGSLIHGETVFIGNDFEGQAEAIMNLYDQNALLAPSFMWTLKASAVGELGIREALERGYDNLDELVPAYLRAPDIRPNPFPPLAGRGVREAGNRESKEIDK